jgi:hypothetical protein
MHRGRTNSLFVSTSATEALYRQPVPPELDPAQLLNELRALRPVIDRLAALEPLIRLLESVSIAGVQQLRTAIAEHNTIMARLEHAEPQIHRVEELIALLDQLEVIVRKQ